MPITSVADMQIVPAKFTEYTIERTTQKSTLVRTGLAVADSLVGQLINGTPKGGNTIIMPKWKPLQAKAQVFGSKELESNKIQTSAEYATLLIREVMWGDSDLATVFGGADPMNAILDLYGDWRVEQEQATFLAIMKGIVGSALSVHVNDISTQTGEKANISYAETLNTKQTLGDAFDKLGVVYMHSATYTELQKQQQIITTFDPTTGVSIQTYANYQVVVDDGMPVTEEGVYDTYFFGKGCFSRNDGTPTGLVTTETFRKNTLSENYLIQRYAMTLHPKGLSFKKSSGFIDSGAYYAADEDLAVAENWELVTHHKNVPIAVLRHKLPSDSVETAAARKAK